MKLRKEIAFLGFLIFLPACLSWFMEMPTFTLKEIALTRFSLKEMNFLFGIEVQNPNNFDLKLRALEYAVYFNDQEVGKGQLEKEVRIAKSSATLVKVPLSADFKSLGSSWGSILSTQDLRYKIEGAAVVKASLGSATIPFSKSGMIRLKK